MNELSIFYDYAWKEAYNNIRFEKYNFSYKLDSNRTLYLESCEVYMDGRILFDYGKEDIILINYINESVLYYICYTLALLLDLDYGYVRNSISFKQTYNG